MSNKIYALKDGNTYFVNEITDRTTGRTTPNMSLLVNNAMLMNKEEIKTWLEKYPFLQTAIINVIRQEI